MWAFPSDRPVRIAAVFAVFPTGPEQPERAWAGAVVMAAGRVLGTAEVRAHVEAPYAPGHLALQRGPLLEAAIRKLEPTPEILLVNATGRDHPRRAGLALHWGRYSISSRSASLIILLSQRPRSPDRRKVLPLP